MSQYFVIKQHIADMKRRLATSPLLLEAEEMGFEIEIKMPKNSLIELQPQLGRLLVVGMEKSNG